MGSRGQKTQRSRAKRQKKQREVGRITAARHREALVSGAHPIHACVVNRHWREAGEASILFARAVAPGQLTMAAFLVDIWAMGLKDAWGRTDLGASEFDEMVSRHCAELEMCPLNVGTARHLVYGGIELARRLGFRLPRRYERWTAVLGPLSEGESPDMSLFLCDGKIRLVCSQRDLEARLVGTTPQKFLARPDVHYILGDDDFTLVDEEEDEVDDMMERIEQAMLEAARRWCFANGQIPHPLLPDVISASLEAIMQGASAEMDAEDDVIEALSGEQHDEISRQTASFLRASFDHEPEALAAAMEQFFGFMGSVGSPEDLLAAVDLDEE